MLHPPRMFLLVVLLLTGLITGLACEKKSPENSATPLTTEPSINSPPDTPGPISAPAEREIALKKFQTIGLAMHTFADANVNWVPVHGIGPRSYSKDAKEKLTLSWRVEMLAYMDRADMMDLWKQFKRDEPWDSPHNKPLIEKMPSVYAPAKPGKPGYTHVQMVIGPNAMHPPRVVVAIATDKGSRDFPDGQTNTIAAIEASEPVIWTKPDDVMLPEKELPKDLKKKFGGQFAGGFHAVMWDGRARFIPDTISEHVLALALNPRRTQSLPKDW